MTPAVMTAPGWMDHDGILGRRKCPPCGEAAVIATVTGTRVVRGEVRPVTVRKCHARAVDEYGDMRWCGWTEAAS